MRITSASQTASLLQQLDSAQSKIANTQIQVSSGQRINVPSDDPLGTGQVMALNASISENQQYQKNANLAISTLGVSENALSSLTDVLNRASELAIQGANSATGVAGQQQIATEVGQLINSAIAIGNTRQSGQYVFAGSQTGTAPMVPDVVGAPGVVNYVGDTSAAQTQIGAGMSVTTGVTGNRIFPAALDALISLRDHLLAGNTAGVSGDISSVSAAQDQALNLRSEIGASTNQAQSSLQVASSQETTLKQSLAGIQDVDLAQSAVDLTAQQNALQAALSTIGRTLSLNLLNFLR